MTPAELVGIGSALGALAATLVSYGVLYGRTKSTIESTTKSVLDLTGSVDKHHSNLEIHIDPKRDDKIIQAVVDSQESGFERMGKWLEKIDSRCEERGKTCSGHFLKIEKKVAAISGKGNGDE